MRSISNLSIRYLEYLLIDGGVRYQRAYVDFFEDQLVLHGYDWKEVLAEFLFEGEEPLVNCLIAGCMA